MLSRNPAFSSFPQPEYCPPHHSLPVRSLRPSSNRIAVADGYGSPRQQQLEKRVVAPPPSHTPPPGPGQQRQRQQHGFNSPRPSLSPLQEYHSGFSNEEPGSPSPYSPASQHRRQQSFSNLLPISFRSRTPSPTRKSPVVPDQMPYTGDGRTSLRAADSSPRGGLAGWLSDTAAASALGMTSSNQEARNQAQDMTPDTTPTKLRRNTTTSGIRMEPTTPKSSVTATASRFMSALSSRFTPAPTSPADLDDELCNLDIEATLFPPGSPVDRDTFSPAAFKNLQTNAVGLLSKLQGAYRDRVIALRDLQAERSAQRDELEEAETRAQHLKMQLEGMAMKAQEQEKAMRQLMNELALERKFRAEERLALSGNKAFGATSEGSIASEDLGVDEERQRLKWKRKSGDTVKSEAGFDDTDEESAESESVFSRCRSPTLAASALDGSTIDYQTPQQQPKSSSSLSLTPRQPRAGQQQISTFQKIIKGIAGEADNAAATGCANYKGQAASMAWDTVSVLRDENKHLKRRVGELEVAVESALDLVNGIGL
ncbi:hypothetical protein B0H63DRAFT_267153 [Podospora didyma]|uniref:Uncharacterized protein n=1 Tax=Podospora didyma TaxID=330526 RepID=A0AAE0KE02_9PEZI|nr:hypothetical protein B0H63DRAFT_267153 [Podospora didyma]